MLVGRLKEVFSAWVMKLRSEYQFCRETSSAARSARGINSRNCSNRVIAPLGQVNV